MKLWLYLIAMFTVGGPAEKVTESLDKVLAAPAIVITSDGAIRGVAGCGATEACQEYDPRVYPWIVRVQLIKRHGEWDKAAHVTKVWVLNGDELIAYSQAPKEERRARGGVVVSVVLEPMDVAAGTELSVVVEIVGGEIAEPVLLRTGRCAV